MQRHKISTLFFTAAVLLAVFLPTTTAHACETCGCTSSGSSFGLSPELNSHFIGLSFGQRSFDGGFSGDLSPSFDSYRSVSLRMGFVHAKKWQFLAHVPYQYNTRNVLDIGAFTTNGLGDASTIVRYTLIATDKGEETSADSTRIQSRLVAGVGLKLPIGQYRTETATDGSLQPPNYQLGSGSWDFLYELMYIARIDDFALQANALYRLNTTNQFDYRFGNQFSTSINLNYSLQRKNWRFIPFGGAYWESLQRDARRSIYQNQTGGSAFFASAGLACFYKNYGLTVSSQLPLQQQYADGEIRSNGRYDIGLTFLF